MTLREKQSLFAKLVASLINHATDFGYELTFGDAYRDPRCPYGLKGGAHSKRLAIDFNLFKDGKYLTETEDHRQLGEYWKSLHPLCRWGGDFKHKDGNHYSLEHDGVM